LEQDFCTVACEASSFSLTLRDVSMFLLFTEKKTMTTSKSDYTWPQFLFFNIEFEMRWINICRILREKDLTLPLGNQPMFLLCCQKKYINNKR
jgi:hypothetical protein